MTYIIISHHILTQFTTTTSTSTTTTTTTTTTAIVIVVIDDSVERCERDVTRGAPHFPPSWNHTVPVVVVAKLPQQRQSRPNHLW